MTERLPKRRFAGPGAALVPYDSPRQGPDVTAATLDADGRMDLPLPSTKFPATESAVAQGLTGMPGTLAFADTGAARERGRYAQVGAPAVEAAGHR